MASKPRSEWSEPYRRRIESAERRHPAATKPALRGHPEESPGTLGVRQATKLSDDLRSASIEPKVIVEGERVAVTTIDASGEKQVTVMSRDQWQRLRSKGRPRKGVPRPKVWEYRKRHRRAA